MPQGELDDLRERLARTRWLDEFPGSGWSYGTSRRYLRSCASTGEPASTGGRARRGSTRSAKWRWTSTGSGYMPSTPGRPSRARSRCCSCTAGRVRSLSSRRSSSRCATRRGTAAAPRTPSTSSARPSPATDSPGPRSAPAGTCGGYRPRSRCSCSGSDTSGTARGQGLGTIITTDLVRSGAGAGVCGLYLTMPLGEPPEGTDDPEAGLSDRERQGLRDWAAHQAAGTVIHHPLNTTRPHTLAFAMNDSPAGLAAWLVDMFRSFSDCGGDVERSFTKEELLANVTTYWLTGTIASAARLYAEWADRSGPRPARPGSKSPPDAAYTRETCEECPGRGRNGYTPSRTGTRCPPEATSPPWRSPNCSSPTSERSSGSSGKASRPSRGRTGHAACPGSAYRQGAAVPPSTWPLTNDASFDARKRITAAISDGCAGLPAAMPATIRWWRSAGIRPVSSSVSAV